MSAQPHEPTPPAAQPTIRSIRAALPFEQQSAFQTELEQTPLNELPAVLAEWSLRARAFAIPDMVKAIAELQDEWSGRKPITPVLSDEEIRDLAPALRP